MNKHKALKAPGVLVGIVGLSGIFLMQSCGEEKAPKPTPEEIQADAEKAFNETNPFPMDRHRGRSVADWIADIESEDRFKRFKAIVSVGEMEEDGALAVSAITRCLNDPESDGGIKRKSIAALGRISGAEAVAGLDSTMRGSDQTLGVLAADALGAMGSWAVDSILPYLNSSDPQVRGRAVRALRSVLNTDGKVTKMEAAVVPLAQALGDKDQVVRDIALGVLSELGPRAHSAAPVIVESLRVEEDREQKKLLMLMVGMFGPVAGDAVGLLRAELRGDDEDLQLFAALALARIGQVDEGVGKLIQFLEDDDPQKRLAAADGLRRIGPPAIEAIEPLKQARKNASDSLHQMVDHALKSIRGQS